LINEDIICFFKYFHVTPTITPPKVNPKNFGIREYTDDITTQKDRIIFKARHISIITRTIKKFTTIFSI
ncbi:MAG: hypothetical protein R3321_08610, partial [Nitrososphaeraceae archaeon]|nr:hypothetical protein [Nitrososphaeraceae archaeon]